jgi:thiosulfate/3-mercaptopyruvate sulfurtransferase
MDTDMFRTDKHTLVSRRTAIRLAACALAVPAVSLFPSNLFPAAAAPNPPQSGGAQDIPPSNVLDPSQLADMLSKPGDKPTVICVGFEFLYNSAHIPGSLYRGPGREGDGIVSLAKWGANAPKNKTVVLYCGCCPWDKCPNIQPSYVALQKLGFSQIKVLRINQNFGADWVDKGLPTEKKKA